MDNFWKYKAFKVCLYKLVSATNSIQLYIKKGRRKASEITEGNNFISANLSMFYILFTQLLYSYF